MTNTQGSVGHNTLPILTTENQMDFRQLMDDSNHNMIGVLAQTMQEIFAPIVQNVTVTNRENTDNMSRIEDFSLRQKGVGRIRRWFEQTYPS